MFFEVVIVGGMTYLGWNDHTKKNKQAKDLHKKTVKYIQKKINEFFSDDIIFPKSEKKTPGKLQKRMNLISQEVRNSYIDHKSGKSELLSKFSNQNEYEIHLVSMALVSSGIGLFFPPFGLFSLPFILMCAYESPLIAYRMLKEKKIGVPLLMTFMTFGGILLGYYFIISLMMLLTRYSMKAIHQITCESSKQFAEFFQQQDDFTFIIIQGKEIRIETNKLEVGDVIAIYAGETLPVDGIIVEGFASIDQSILTGEANPVDVSVGEKVFASTTVLAGKMFVEVQQTGKDVVSSKIIQTLNQTVDFKSLVQLRSESVSDRLVTPVLISSAVISPFLGLQSGIALLDTHPLNKLNLYGPIYIMQYLKIAASKGIVIKDGRCLELLSEIDTVIFDKTGTLTTDELKVSSITTYSYFNEDEVLCYAATAEARQSHPLAKAIIKEAKQQSISLLTLSKSNYKMGYGLVVVVDGKRIHIGSYKLMESSNIKISQEMQSQQSLCHEKGINLVFVAVNTNIIGTIELIPTIRPEAKKIIQFLKNRENIKTTYIISGDHENPTQRMAAELGIDHYFAEVLPEGKSQIIDDLQKQGNNICYIGDGINDSIALKKAKVSISISGASNIAIDTAQIVLTNGGIQSLEALFEIAEEFNNKLNSIFALNLMPSPIIFTGVLFFGFTLPQTLGIHLLNSTLEIVYTLHFLNKSKKYNENKPPYTSENYVQEEENKKLIGGMPKKICIKEENEKPLNLTKVM